MLRPGFVKHFRELYGDLEELMALKQRVENNPLMIWSDQEKAKILAELAKQKDLTVERMKGLLE